MEFVSKSESETKAKAGEFLKSLNNKKENEGALILALEGDLGSGKTTFTQGLAESLAITERVNSPTFVIEKIYKIENNPQFKHLVHIDAYRLDNESELAHLGWKEIAENPKNLVVVEWSERVLGLLPQTAVKISFQFLNETERKIIW